MQVDVDFEVFKSLTMRRATEATTYNDVLRDLLNLKNKQSAAPAPKAGSGCSFKGVFLPDGTQLRVVYKGNTHRAEIKDGNWIDQNGQRRNSPSDAATALTNTQVNGWRFWDVKRPNDPAWRKLMTLL